MTLPAVAWSCAESLELDSHTEQPAVVCIEIAGRFVADLPFEAHG